MIRHLVWHIETLVGDNTSLGPVFTLDRDYTPRAVRIHCKVPAGGDMRIDIKDDGESIFRALPRLPSGRQDELGDDGFSATNLAKYSLVSLDIPTNATPGTTVTLELTSDEEDSDVEAQAI